MSDRVDGNLYKLLDDRETLQCSPIQLTAKCLHHSTTGLVHCVMTRQTASSRLIHLASKKHLLSYQCPQKQGEETVTKPILAGIKESGHSYSIHSIDSDNTEVNGPKIGSLVRVQMNMYSISYALKNNAGESIAFIVYHVPSPIKAIRDTPSRFAEIALDQPPHLFDNDEHHSDDHSIPIEQKNKKDSASTPNFDKVCMDNISKHHTLTGTNQVDNSIVLFRNLEPYVSSSTGRITLNFHGRGRYASPKNMQMIVSHPTTATTKRSNPSTNSKNTNVSLQMCKWDDDIYHLDFDTPMTFLHAFAFGLAQIDL
jgi:Tub family